MKKNRRFKPQDPYFRDDFPHIVLTIENAHVLSKHYDKRALDYLDHLILRLFNHQGFRRHFPVILEHNDPLFFNYGMANYLQEKETNFS